MGICWSVAWCVKGSPGFSALQAVPSLDQSGCPAGCCAHTRLSAPYLVSITTTPRTRPPISTITVSLLCGGYARSGLTGCGSLLLVQISTESTRKHPSTWSECSRTSPTATCLMVSRWAARCWIFSGSTVFTAKTPPMQSALRRFPESFALLLTGSAPRDDAHLTAV